MLKWYLTTKFSRNRYDLQVNPTNYYVVTISRTKIGTLYIQGGCESMRRYRGFRLTDIKDKIVIGDDYRS